MKFFSFAFLVLSTCYFSVAFGGPWGPDTCANIGTNVAVGTTCKNYFGNSFLRVSGGWKDPLGVTWYDGVVKGVSYSEAQNYCESKKQRLPKASDFGDVNVNEIVMVGRDPNMYYWTSSQWGYPDKRGLYHASSWHNTYFVQQVDPATRQDNIDDQNDEHLDNYGIYFARCVTP